jgi:hypothetical protein
MSAHDKTRKLDLACMIVAIGLALPAGFGVALAAEERSAGEIIKALKPERLTRGLTTSPADAARNAEEAKFVLDDRRARADHIDRPEAAEHRSRSELRLQF